MKTIRIVLADDHTVVRKGLRLLLESHPGLNVVADAANGRETVALAEQHRPDVVVMDIAMPELNGIEAARQISAKLRALRAPEPYKGKGVKYAEEVIKKKVGKAAATGGSGG